MLRNISDMFTTADIAGQASTKKKRQTFFKKTLQFPRPLSSISGWSCGQKMKNGQRSALVPSAAFSPNSRKKRSFEESQTPDKWYVLNFETSWTWMGPDGVCVVAGEEADIFCLPFFWWSLQVGCFQRKTQWVFAFSFLSLCVLQLVWCSILMIANHPLSEFTIFLVQFEFILEIWRVLRCSWSGSSRRQGPPENSGRIYEFQWHRHELHGDVGFLFVLVK